MKKFSTITAALLFVGQSAFANPIIIDIDRAMQPIGDLKINGESASGYITGIDINVNAVAVDDFNRGFKVGLNSAQHVHETFNSTTDMSGITHTAKTDIGDVRIVAKNLHEWTFATRLVDEAIKYDVYVKTRYRHPFMGFGGVYGDIKLNAIVDNVFTYNFGNYYTKAGLMATHTWFDQGIVKDVSTQLGTWGELGYRNNGFNIATGVYPVGIAGKINMLYPDQQDNQTGDLSYTSRDFNTNTEAQTFVRAEYAFSVGNGDISFGLFASSTSNWDKIKTYQSLSYNIVF